ncbi:glycosyltransferase [soil metagenome]
MTLVVFGLAVSSSWGNGHATTYRALLGAFAARGHEIVFYEWNAPWYGGGHRDLPDPPFCRLELYDRWERVRERAIAEARDADATLVGSYVHRGREVIDALAGACVEPLFFYDVDTPVTVGLLRRGEAEYLRRDQVPVFTRYLSFTGGPFLQAVVEGELGAREAVPLYCSVDERVYGETYPQAEFAADLAYMGTYAEDRQPTLDRLLLEPARRAGDRTFLVAGPQYPQAIRWPTNVRRLLHVPPSRHPAFYSSAAWQLNVTRAEMRAAGWSPSVRFFEAAACGAALLSDRWPGIEHFLRPGEEILLPDSTEEVLGILAETHPDERRAIGAAASSRILAEHTAERRAGELEALLGVSAFAPPMPV